MTKKSKYLACESRRVYELLMISAGMMGAYTFNLRGGVFCNAQTANFVLMAAALGNGNIRHGLYYLIPVSAYAFGAFLSQLLPSPVKKLGVFRWDTCLILFETAVLFALGFIPLGAPPQYVQIIINFICSMQYNTFRQANGVPMATTFCTNHVRQVGISVADAIRKRDAGRLKKGAAHLLMIAGFLGGAAVQTAACSFFGAKSVWCAALPMLAAAVILAYADIFTERGMLDKKPAGH